MNQARVGFIASILVLLALSCTDNPVNRVEQSQYISGFVEGWQNGGLLDKLDIGITNSYYFMKLDSTEIILDGKFSIHYPFPIPPDSVLRSYKPILDTNQFIGNIDNILFSNSKARYVSLCFWVYESHHLGRMNLFLSNRYLTNDSTSAVGDYFIQYYFFNQPTTISGSHRLSFYVPNWSLHSKFNTYITNYDLNALSGWNQIVTQIEQIHDSTIVYKVSTDISKVPCWFPSWFESLNFDYVNYW